MFNWKAMLLSPTTQIVAQFLGLLPILIAFLLAITATMGPKLIPSPSFCLMKITAPPGVPEPEGPSGAFFGTWGSCYRINGGPMICTPSAENPFYNATIDAMVDNGVPRFFTQRIVHHLIQTPQVQITGFVLLFLSMVIALPALFAAFLPALRFSPSRYLNPKWSQRVFWVSAFCLFWGFLLCLTASLSQNDQFSQAAALYNNLVRIRGRDIATVGFQHAEIGSAFSQQWAAVTFMCLGILYQTVVYLKWPEEDTMGYWSSKPTAWSGKA